VLKSYFWYGGAMKRWTKSSSPPLSHSLSLLFLGGGEVGELTNQVVWMEGDANMA